MRSNRVETYESSSGSWHAVTVDYFATHHAYGESEAAALINLCEELLDEIEMEMPHDA